MSIEILPRLWLTNDISVIKNKNFYVSNNIKYVVNLTYDIPNYFKNITYFNVPFSNENFKESEIIMSIQQLFDAVNRFITQGYNFGIGILIYDKSGNLSMLFTIAFLIGALKIPLNDAINYLKIHKLNVNNYILSNEHLINYHKLMINKQCY